MRLTPREALNKARWIYDREYQAFNKDRFAQLERELGNPLPSVYRHVLELFGGVELLGFNLRVQNQEGFEIERLLPLHQLEITRHQSSGRGVLSELSKVGTTGELDRGRLELCWLTIGEAEVESIVLAVGGPVDGRVALWDEAHGDTEWVAASFDEFWQMVVAVPEADPYEGPAEQALAASRGFGVSGADAAIARSEDYWQAFIEAEEPGAMARRREVYEVVVEHAGDIIDAPHPFNASSSADALAQLATATRRHSRGEYRDRAALEDKVRSLLRDTESSGDRETVHAIAKALYALPELDSSGEPIAEAPPAPRPVKRRVRHAKFGTGVVVSEQGEKLEVQFEDARRVILSNFVTDEPP